MHAKIKRIRILALLLGVIFLGAQFHFCTDLTATPSASHICPVCSTTSSVVATQSLVIAIVPVTNWLEIAPLAVSPSSAVSRATSPRPPPPPSPRRSFRRSSDLQFTFFIYVLGP